MEIPKNRQIITNFVGGLKNSKVEGKKLPKITYPLGMLAVATLGCRSLETGDIAGALVLAVGFPALIYIGSKVFFGNSGKKK